MPVVGIGASAGGLEAVSALLGRMAADSMALVVFQHLAPNHESKLTEILGRVTSLPVVTAADGLAVARGTIYVAPPGVELTLEGGALHLGPSTSEQPHHPIDRLFRSLARDLGERAIGVVLSGVGSDGTLGLRAIRVAGGIAFVQEPSTAGQAGMPQSAIDAGCADFCLTPGEIGDELMRLATHPYVARPPRGLDESTRVKLLTQLRQSFGVDFAAYKQSTIERRIERRMALKNLALIDDYLAFVREHPDELGLLYSDLLIGVTQFFRDREPFELLKTVVFPRLLERRATDTPIRIWVPGCSTGEEAYSIAMALLEYLDTRAAAFKIQIFATDIDEASLATARRGIYSKDLAVDISPERLQRFFTRQDHGYQVSRQLRDLVIVARHNLGKDPPFSRLDLVSCRNVLIYLQPALQRRVLHSIHYGLEPDAYLLLGLSESVGDAADLFTLVDRRFKLYTKKNIASAAVFEFPTGRVVDGAPLARVDPARGRTVPISIQQLADRKILERFGPPGVLVDPRLEVVQFRGQTGPFLAPLPGQATLSLLKLVRPELVLELRSAIAEATRTGVAVVAPPIRLTSTHQPVVLEVIPILENEGPTSILIRAPPAPIVAPTAAPEPPIDVTSGTRVKDLERELLVSREYLQTSVQELQLSNEELQSSNEELQSTNEEIETSKEELQCTNEELSTINEELQNRMAQLATSNDDLQNLLARMSGAIVIVGTDLRIRRFSAAAEKLLSLVGEDVGRPVAYLGTALNLPQLEAMVTETIQTMHERAQRVRCSDGQWYTICAYPYLTADHAIRGALLELVRVPPGRKLGELPEIQELAGKVLSTLPDVLMLLDDQLRILWVNRAFFEAFHVGAEILGRPLDELWVGVRGQTALWTGLVEAAGGRSVLDAMQVDHPFESATPMIFSARSIAAEQDRPPLALVTMRDVPAKT
ncbi:MAG: PAS domain-containing protein [Proteobacteria bacterium]|nr:PAS domain-containing protein [Pseudomonadota bacterium]